MFKRLFQSAATLASDAYLDFARRDDAELGAYVMTSIGCADGSLGDDERAAVVKLLQTMFRNFDPSEIAAFARDAFTAHEFPELGFIATEDKLRAFKDDAGSLKRIFVAAAVVAKKDGELDPKERDLLLRFLSVQGTIKPQEIGL